MSHSSSALQCNVVFDYAFPVLFTSSLVVRGCCIAQGQSSLQSVNVQYVLAMIQTPSIREQWGASGNNHAVLLPLHAWEEVPLSSSMTF